MKLEPNSKLIRSLTITNELGLHARAAGKLARVAEQAASKVFVIKDGQEVDATHVLDILSLYCPCGTEVTLKITDPDDRHILDRMAQLIETGFAEF
jgi:phosphocarrier protein HPr